MVNLAAGSSAGESAPLTFNKKECLESKLVRTSSEKIFCSQESVSLLNQCLGEENQDSIKNFQRTENPWKGHKKTFFKKKKTNFMAPFYGWGSTASRLLPLGGSSLLFTIQRK